MPRIWIGIDQSYSGCAIVHHVRYDENDTYTDEKVCDFSPKAAGLGIERLLHVHHELLAHFQDIARLGYVAHLCYEGYAYGAKYRREELGELGAMMKTALALAFPSHFEDRVHAVAPSTVKKFATGSGRADKDKVMLAVYMRWQYQPPSHDVADAYTLAHIAEALDRPEPPELKFQREVLATVRSPTS
ncbi:MULTISPECIES: hypothetical protein [unclassified Streptomyces]|uniref:hypothetical protein n=1 Tax=unclassified Streptomyces TaxID=2593676 RepID=UPI003D89DDC0